MKCLLLQSVFRRFIAEMTLAEKFAIKELTERGYTEIKNENVAQAELIAEEILEIDENNCDALIFKFIASDEKDGCMFLIKSISISDKNVANTLIDILPQKKLIEILKKLGETETIEIIHKWILDFFPFMTKTVTSWEEREIQTFFSFLKMEAGGKVLQEGFTNGASLVKMSREDWKDLELPLGVFAGLRFWLDEFHQSFSPKKIISRPTSSLPWDIDSDILCMKEWIEKGHERLRYKTILLKSGNVIVDKKQARYVEELCKKLNLRENTCLHRIYMIHNEMLDMRFNASLDAIFNRWRSTPHLFRKMGWKEAKDYELRAWYEDHFEKEVDKWEWNKDRQVFISSSSPNLISARIGSLVDGTWNK